jgi:hypothetical protein
MTAKERGWGQFSLYTNHVIWGGRNQSVNMDTYQPVLGSTPTNRPFMQQTGFTKCIQV